MRARRAKVLKQTDLELEKMNYLVEGVLGSALAILRLATAWLRHPRGGGSARQGRPGGGRFRPALEKAVMRSAFKEFALPVFAIAAALLLFGLVVAFAGVDPVEVWTTLFKGAFGDWFSWQNTLQRAAPLMLTALCVALPARAGLIVIGGRGRAGVRRPACAALAHTLPLPSGVAGILVLCIAGAAVGALWIMLAGWLRQYRGINETISGLLLAYIRDRHLQAPGGRPLRDPASLNKPSTYALPDGLLIGRHRRFRRALGAGGRHRRLPGPRGAPRRLPASRCAWWAATAHRAARGLPAARLILGACGLGGACAGVAGAIEVAAVHATPTPR